LHISEIFQLNRSQHELDFVDVDISVDTPLFLEPYYLKRAVDPWCQNVSSTIQSYTNLLLSLLREQRIDEARDLMEHLGEPNETSLGLSVGRPRGRGVGDEQVQQMIDRLIRNEAIARGLVTDLEDIRVLVPRMGPDKLSDIVTNIIRGHLIEYTQGQCDLLGIALTPDLISSPFWDRDERRWTQARTDLLHADGRHILLVPKSAVSRARAYTRSRYHRHHVLPFLQGDHLRRNTNLVNVRRLKSGAEKRWVYKSDLIAREAPENLEFLIPFTERHPEIFQDFKTTIPDKNLDALNSDEIAEYARLGGQGRTTAAEVAEHLINRLQAINPGHADASLFHQLVHAVLELVFYPRLSKPVKEHEIEQGTKRIDLTFDNAARHGFFERLHLTDNLPSRYIFFECKNYTQDPRNPEFDQLSGRFSVNTGRVGFLVCRRVADMEELVRRCHHAYVAGRGLMIPLDDQDLTAMLQERAEDVKHPGEDLLFTRKRSIMFG
jgi:hypothetical protein